MYRLHTAATASVTLSQLRNRQSDYIATAQSEPVEITSRGAGRRAVLVSPEFFDRAVKAMEDLADIPAADEARKETGRVSQEELERELGL
ncbi:type II toxin-antitoxin system prevent-host-death family antitoxin [Corynebacterium pygosceleis]|uniref:type II toxin-antitoxin system prevent-host-death family antitoxin n=1 Tax=Corynebacterium pygosceleis TaxID=2800406 RepID=UPI0019066255|nr:type II toxin-antitoxin system prevent-host-death family antitoxin [Corynebacterium pygosceleis]MCK7675864.1 type II toxin-antitoxin system Phd/YefM family antitoxin [Corynebacterium pygosceleis]MCL0120754.1 type II toxin-antitoxin system Phd/YefM family antitoxin [Corynebacterium pygosceleis]